MESLQVYAACLQFIASFSITVDKHSSPLLNVVLLLSLFRCRGIQVYGPTIAGQDSGYFLGIIRHGPMSMKFDGPFL